MAFDPADYARAYEPTVTYATGTHTTDNPDGVTVSTDDYTPKCHEEKATALGVTEVVPVDVEPNEPYPDASSP